MNIEYLKNLYKNFELFKKNHLTDFLLAEQFQFKNVLVHFDQVSLMLLFKFRLKKLEKSSILDTIKMIKLIKFKVLKLIRTQKHISVITRENKIIKRT